MLLYNPAVDLGVLAGAKPEWSPKNQLRAGMPPMVMFFGTEDPHYRNAQPYFEKAVGLKNEVELYYAKGQKHGFFNDNPGGDYTWHASTLYMTDSFLARHNFLAGKPTIAQPDGSRGVLYSEAARVPVSGSGRPVPAGVKLERDVVYAKVGERELKLDLYLPATSSGVKLRPNAGFRESTSIRSWVTRAALMRSASPPAITRVPPPVSKKAIFSKVWFRSRQA